MIDITSETVVTMAEATKYLPRRRRGARPSPSTLFRWASSGYRGVKLETIRIAGTICTSVQALQRFCDACSGPQADGRDPVAVRTTAGRQRAIRAAERELDAMGV